MLEGIPPYKLAYNMKLPGTYAAYAALMAMFGETSSGVHEGFLVVNALTICLIFLLGTRLFGRLAGLVAATSYALLAVSPRILGFAAHASHFVVLFAVAGALVLLKAVQVKRTWMLCASGLLFGLAFLMEQQGIFFAVFAGLYLLVDEIQGRAATRSFDLTGTAKRLGLLGIGVLTPFGLTCLALWRAGAFRQFWFWTFRYARQYVGIVSFAVGQPEPEDGAARRYRTFLAPVASRGLGLDRLPLEQSDPLTRSLHGSFSGVFRSRGLPRLLFPTALFRRDAARPRPADWSSR